MKKQKKVVIMLLLILLISILVENKVFALNKEELTKSVEYTENFKNYLELSEEERKKVLMPNPYEIKKTTTQTKNILKMARMLGTGITESRYSLKDVIPENVVVRNQKATNTCWAFASLASLESTLALQNYKAQISAKTYDFSERHMNYSASREFANNQINIYGYNKALNEGGNWYMAKSYLTNGNGAINETDMPFESNSNTINISEIQNKQVVSRVYDTIEFPSYSITEDTTEIKQKIKEHIKNNGAVFAAIHGAKLTSNYCNIVTGAIYCDNKNDCKIDHAVAIIGWDDDYGIDKFNENHRPQNKGAWIIKNSWGNKLEYGTIETVRQEVFNIYKDQLAEKGITEASQITNEEMNQLIAILGWTIEGDKVYIPIGDNGIMYISYEDVNVYSGLSGIQKASDSVDYVNIYQYDELSATGQLESSISKIYMANIFSKKTTGSEYLTRSRNKCT